MTANPIGYESTALIGATLTTIAQDSKTPPTPTHKTLKPHTGPHCRVPRWVHRYFWREMRKIDADLVYMVLADYATYISNVTRPGVRLLARETRMQPARVVAALAWMVEHGLLELWEPASGRRATVYRIVKSPPPGVPIQGDFREQNQADSSVVYEPESDPLAPTIIDTTSEVSASQKAVSASRERQPEGEESGDNEPETQNLGVKTTKTTGSAPLFPSYEGNTTTPVVSQKRREAAEEIYRGFKHKAPNAKPPTPSQVIEAVRIWPSWHIKTAIGRCDAKTGSWAAVVYALTHDPQRFPTREQKKQIDQDAGEERARRQEQQQQDQAKAVSPDRWKEKLRETRASLEELKKQPA